MATGVTQCFKEDFTFQREYNKIVVMKSVKSQGIHYSSVTISVVILNDMCFVDDCLLGYSGMYSGRN